MTDPQGITLDKAIDAGLALHRLGRLGEAEDIYRRAVQAQPDNPDLYHLLGIIARQSGRYDDALHLADQALAIRPDHAEALSSRAEALFALRRYEEALASADRALAIRPRYLDACNNRCNALHALKRYAEALAAYDCVLELKPDYPEALNNRGHALHELGRHEEALACYDAALRLMPEVPEAISNRADTLCELGRYDEAFAGFDRAISLKPGYVDALNKLGSALRRVGRYKEALASYREAQVRRPGDGASLWNESMCHLALGDYETGWKLYEWRWTCEEFLGHKREFGRPLWLGAEDLTGKAILLHAEQGLGDTIQLVRYVDAVASKGARAVLEVQPPLKPLMASSFRQHEVVARGEPLPGFDYHCSLMSLPLAFGTRLESIPSATPYLRAPPHKVDQWRARLGTKARPMVGIVWSGFRGHRQDRLRSIALRELLPLARCGVELVSVQKEVREEDRAVLAQAQITDYGDWLQDFADTAALLSCLDLVISVDTSVAHLAGALARPVWVLLPYGPDWRWLLDRNDSPWYPTARLFRQPAVGDWNGVLAGVSNALQEWAATRP